MNPVAIDTLILLRAAGEGDREAVEGARAARDRADALTTANGEGSEYPWLTRPLHPFGVPLPRKRTGEDYEATLHD